MHTCNTLNTSVYHYPFGMIMSGRNESADDYRYGFNGMEKDDEVSGSKNSYDFGARFYNPRVGRWLSVDPLEAKYTDFSPYIGFGNSPIIYFDIDGRDIVYFDANGNETSRIENPDVHETWVATTTMVMAPTGTSDLEWISVETYVKAPMPNRIYVTESGDNHDYNQYDHIIACETYLFNEKKNSGELTPLSNLTSDPDGNEISDLSPNNVKSVMLKETRGGKINGGFRNGRLDVMQVNVTGDWSWRKSLVGLSEGESVGSAQQSIHAGIMFLYWKGVTIETVKDENGRTVGWESKWTGGTSWAGAIKAYNGGGDPDYMKKFLKHYQGLLNGMTDGALDELYDSTDEENNTDSDTNSNDSDSESSEENGGS